MELKNLSKQIDEQLVFNDISFSLEPGQIVGLIGRNGSGKTTLFRTIANHYQADQGQVLIDGQALSDHLENYQQLFYLDMQEHPLNQLTPKQIGAYYGPLYPTFNQEKYANFIKTYRLPASKYRYYSKGMKGLLHVILAFSTGAKYVLLDEPFDGLDILIRKQVIRLLLDEVSQHNLTVLISSHNLSELENIIERALIIKDQRLVKDYNLEVIRETSVKVQMVFTTSEIPELITEHCTIISQQGRVIIGIFPKLSKDLLIQIELLKPVLFEELPVSLEDLFTTNLVEDDDYQLTN